jgi:hypothetical protein
LAAVNDAVGFLDFDGQMLIDEVQRAPGLWLAIKNSVDRDARGGYPAAVQRDTPRRRDRFFSSYLNDIVVRDIKQVADIERAADMRRLVALLAARCGGMINMAELASELTITELTVRVPPAPGASMAVSSGAAGPPTRNRPSGRGQAGGPSSEPVAIGWSGSVIQSDQEPT